MNINRNNYEAYILDYLEGSISPEDKAMLLSFLDANPDLKDALDVPVDLVLPYVPVSTFDKSTLKKHPADEYELEPIEYLQIKYQEEGLTTNEKDELKSLQPNNKKREQEQKLFSLSFLKADLSTIYDEKSQLKRYAIFNRLKMQHVAAAIAIAVLATAAWFVPKQLTQNTTTIIAHNSDTNTKQNQVLAEIQPKVDNKRIIQSTPSKDSLMQIAKDPMGVSKQNSRKKTKAKIIAKEETTLNNLVALNQIRITNSDSINGYEYALNVMMPQYMSNNILSRQLADIYKKIEEDNEIPAKNLALVEGGVRFLNFFSKDAVSLDKYYDEEGNLIGYNLKGNALTVRRRAQ
nr:hypothetical protein [uncultured Carboxylicivirga sp.]